MNFSSTYMNFFSVFQTLFRCILLVSTYGNLRFFVYVIIPFVGAGITTLMSISDGLVQNFFR